MALVENTLSAVRSQAERVIRVTCQGQEVFGGRVGLRWRWRSPELGEMETEGEMRGGGGGTIDANGQPRGGSA